MNPIKRRQVNLALVNLNFQGGFIKQVSPIKMPQCSSMEYTYYADICKKFADSILQKYSYLVIYVRCSTM